MQLFHQHKIQHPILHMKKIKIIPQQGPFPNSYMSAILPPVVPWINCPSHCIIMQLQCDRLLWYLLLPLNRRSKGTMVKSKEWYTHCWNSCSRTICMFIMCSFILWTFDRHHFTGSISWANIIEGVEDSRNNQLQLILFQTSWITGERKQGNIMTRV